MTGAPVYLDYAATTPPEPRVARFLAELFAAPAGNARSLREGFPIFPVPGAIWCTWGFACAPLVTQTG